jgi:glucokinase
MQTDKLSPYILTADIGGSHVTAGIYHKQTQVIAPSSTIRASVASKGTADEILSAWKNAIAAAYTTKNLAVSGLALAMPGPFDYENGISYIKGLDKYESIYEMDIKKYLADELGMDTQMVCFRNDAASTIAGEALAGAGKNYNKVIGITLGTGFGSAFCNAGNTEDLNLGSTPYQDTIADDYFSTRWFVKYYLEITGTKLTNGVKELTELAKESDTARQVFKVFADNLAQFLSDPIKQLQPDVLVICGNIAKASDLFLPRLANNLNSINITIAQLGEDAPLIGAAAIFE